MNILMVSSYLPYPLYSGGHVRLFNIIKHLAKNHTITLVCEKREYQTDEDIAAVKKYCKEVFVFPRKKQWSIKTVSKTGISAYPFLLIGHTSLPMKKKIKELLVSQSFSLIHVETFYVLQNIPRTYLPVVLIEHNIEYLVYERFVQQAPLFIRPFLSIDILKLKYWEKKAWQKATKLIAVSEEEKKIMKPPDVSVVENGVDLPTFKMSDSALKQKKQRKKVLFIGDFKWIQNKSSLEWILKEIWPEISSEFKVQSPKSSVKLWVVGKNIPQSLKDLATDQSVIFDEDAGDTAKVFAQADVLLSPIRVGGGTSFKILEAMASGVPVVTTPLGIEGIDATNSKEVLLGETSAELADSVVNVLTNDKVYISVAKQARKLIEEKYDWEKIVKKLEHAYKEARES